MSHLSKTKQVANVERRTWDVEAYEQKALARQQPPRDSGHNEEAVNGKIPDAATKEEFQAAPKGAVGPEGSQRAFLQARKRKITEIDNRVGTSVSLSVEEATGSKKEAIKLSDGVKSTGVGFHCTVCDCFLKDSMTYLDHINGRKHQRKLGFTMRVERSTESDVLNKLESLKRQHAKNDSTVQGELNFDVLVREKDEAEERRKEERQRKRKERRQLQKKIQSEPDNQYDLEEEIEEEDAQIDPDMAALMGFSGFAGGKK
jgi:U4/U6.U5 tri-snRNP component SNU23